MQIPYNRDSAVLVMLFSQKHPFSFCSVSTSMKLENEDYSRINNTWRSLSNINFWPHQAQFQPFFVAWTSHWFHARHSCLFCMCKLSFKHLLKDCIFSTSCNCHYFAASNLKLGSMPFNHFHVRLKKVDSMCPKPTRPQTAR